MLLEGTLIKDQHKDTLLYAGALKVNVNDWFFLKDKIVLEYIGLEDATIYLHRSDNPKWNYDFLADFFSAPPSSKPKKAISLDLKKIEISDLHFLKKDEWRGENQALTLHSLDVTAREVNFNTKKILIEDIAIIDPIFSIYDYVGKRPPRPKRPKNTPAKDTLTKLTDTIQQDSPGWNLMVTNCTIKNGAFKNDHQTERAPYYYFDGAHFLFKDVNAQFKNVRYQKDTLFVALTLSTKERSGFEVKSMKANVRFHPKAMEFHDLDIRTAKSRLRNYFAMNYDDFDDMGDFIEKIVMEGRFKDAEIDSDDIAYFAPALADWKKHIRASGNVKGTVENLTGRNLLLEAGKNSILSGDLSLRGLPDIDKTFIDFNAREFRTTYDDVVTIVPSVKDIKEPNLASIKALAFKGNFTGFVHDFVTYGTIETNLGVLKTDVNMKLPSNGLASYSGKLDTKDFDLGSFLNNPQFGKFSFNGTVKGKGFSLKTMQASLDGTIPHIAFNGYDYQNIKVNGTVAKSLFNGHLNIVDENATADLNGLIDLSKKTPVFDFTANIERLNFKKMNFTKDDIDFNGEVNFNFTGNNIDNFLGSARIYNASVYKNGQRISFDSLALYSSVDEQNNKLLRLQSNELEASINGKFVIMQLPAAFQSFLNRYYPSYIKPFARKDPDDNFTFSVKTGKIDDYLDLIDKNLKGFNNATVSGRINSKETIFQLDANIPQFAYKQFNFTNVDLEGRGNLDSLSLHTNIDDVFVNDSLHFPHTDITINSSSDFSKVKITTSANQTLNTAEIQGEVQTLKNGVRILFSPSVFDINGKKWTIDKNGELILTKELVSTDGLRISSGEQEVYISSASSGKGAANDLKIALRNISIGDFAPFFVKGSRLEGRITGTVDVIDPYGEMRIEANAIAERFRMDNDSIGTIQLNSNYQMRTGNVNFTARSQNENYNFDINGAFNTIDSATQNLDIMANLQNTNINLLENYLGNLFSRISGKANGQLRIVGPPNNLKYLGKVDLTNGALEVDYTRCYYLIPNASFTFADGYIDFGSFTIKDTLDNTAEITVGKLYHQGFNNLAFDFKLKTNKLLVLNTTAKDNSQFYGSVIAKANLSFSGPQDDMEMTIKGEPTDSSKIYLPTGSSRESGDADFIVWKVYGREMKQYEDYLKETNLHISLDITANSYAKVYMIMDELTGDIIEATGTGNLKIKVGTKEALTMNGRFDIEKGNYNFSFQSIKRKFILKPDAGNSISWNGDPYQANLRITAVYEAENVQFNDLLSSNAQFDNSIFDNVKKFRGKVLVIANITDRLTAPKISFDIELPDNSPIRNEPAVATVFQFIKNDENELNKQVSFLILFNSFGPLTSGAKSSATAGSNIANAAFEGIVVNSISGFLSSVLTREVSNILQGVFNDKSLRVNINASLYSGINLTTGQTNSQISLPDRTNLNVSIGKSFFNERLTFVFGSALDFGLNSQQNQAAFAFLPDVTAEYKLTPDGKFLLTFFYRNNYSYIARGALNRSGASISYRREFSTFMEFINGLFGRKKSDK